MPKKWDKYSEEKHAISVVRAKGLRSADWNGYSDPYVTCRIEGFQGSESQIFKTGVIKKNLNPEWNERHNIEEYLVGKVLILDVWDWDLSQSDDFLGTCKLELDPAYFVPGAVV